MCVPEFEAANFFEWVAKFRPTWYTAVPAMHRSILGRAKRNPAGAGGTGLRFIRSASASLSRELRDDMERTFSVPVVEAYGLTEASDIAFTPLPPDVCNPKSVGRAINGEIGIVDEKGGLLPSGKMGEIVVRGPSLFHGYANDSEADRSSFIDGWFRTGDLGELDADGFLFLTGRIKEIINRGGEKILPWEVDEVLLTHPSVADAAAFALPDQRLGENVGAAVVLRDKSTATEAELQKFVSQHLSDFKVPQRIVFLHEIPKGPTGKSIRIGLAERLGLSAPDAGNSASIQPFVAPRTETERRLAAIWREVLGLDKVGVHDDFFHLGGDSILGIQVIVRARSEFGVDLPMFGLLGTPRIETLARWIEEQREKNGVSDQSSNPSSAIAPSKVPLVELNAEQVQRIAEGVTGGKENLQDIYPLAPLQEGIFFHHMMGGEGDPYLLVTLVRFQSRAKLESYLAALQSVVDRNDILRTAIAWEGLPEPLQVVWRKVSLPVEEVALDAEAGDAAEQLYSYFDPLNHRIDLRQAPLLRTFVAEDKKNKCWLMLLARHHLVTDHMSTGLMRQEIQAHLAGRAEELPAPVPFRNLVEQARLHTNAQEHESFFRGMLGDVAEPTAPFGLMDVRRDGRGIEERQLLVNRKLTQRIRAGARRLGVSVASICHVAWGQVLTKVSGQDDVVFGTLVFGRMHGGEGADRVLGLSINTLPVRVRLGGEGAEASVLRTHAMLGELMRHEHATLALAQRCSGVAAPMPLFTSLLNYRYGTGAAKSNSEEALRVWDGIETIRFEERTNYPLVLAVDDLGEDLVLVAQTLTEISAIRVCRFMRKALEGLIEKLENAPTTSMQSVSILDEPERHELTIEWNNTAAELQKPDTVAGWIEQQAERTPESRALAFEGKHLTYAELNHRANQLAHYLKKQGVGPDVLVGICLERSVEMVVALVGVLKAGGAYLPLDPAYPKDRLAFMLEDAKAPVVLTTTRLMEELPAHSAKVVCLDRDAKLLEQEPGTNLKSEVGPENLIYAIYTSGSTGKPKGVGNTQRGVLNRLQWMQGAYGLKSGDRVMQKTPYSFDVSVWEFFWPLMVGAELVVARPEGHKDPEYIADLIKEQGITTMHFVPSMLRVFLETEGLEKRCGSLRRVFCSGEALGYELQERFFERLPGVELHNLYGPTEAAVDVTSWKCEPKDGRGIVPIGKPIWNTQIYILDKNLEPVPVGVPGELHIGGMGLARGYLNRAELTAEKFIADPISGKAGARLYKTGDLARYLADGNIEYLGRIDHQVKIRGFRIELGEIEAVLSKHPAVMEAVVVAREDKPGEKWLVGYVVAGTVAPSIQELREYLRKQLPDYMVPAAFVTLEKMPLTASGKADRKALPAPDAASMAAVDGYVAPKTRVQELLAQIWEEVLKRDRVGVEDDFFSLGGHSLLAIQVIARINDAFQTALPIRRLFEAPTVALLAMVVEEARGKKTQVVPPIVRTGREGDLPLSFAQERLWFLDQFAPGDVSYNVAMSADIQGELNEQVLEKCLQEIVNRHESLRTRFLATDGKPRQVIETNVNLELHVIDLRSLANDKRKMEAERLEREEARKPFDLSQAPLLRASILRIDQANRVLLLTMHHIVSDGLSMEALFPELTTLYEAFSAGKPSPLQKLPVQYADFSIWQRNWMSGEMLDRQLAYWKNQLEGAETLELPSDRARPAIKGRSGAYVPIEVPAEVLSLLKQLSRRTGTTLYMTLLAAFVTLLHRYTRQQDISVGSPVAGRTKVETEKLIGFFVNTLVMRTKLSGENSFLDVLRMVKEEALEASANQDVPFEKLVEVLAPHRDLSRTPLFQVMFALQNAPLPHLQLGEAKLRARYGDTGTSKFDLSMNLEELDGAIQGRLVYNTEIFDEATIARMAGHFKTLLKNILVNPDLPVSTIAILDERERNEIVIGFNQPPDARRASELPLDGGATLNALFEAQVARRPNAVALTCEGESVTYAQLNAEANRVARKLVESGIKPDTLVGLCMERSAEIVIGILAILKAGGAYLPIDLAYPADRLAFMMEDAQAPVMLTQRKLLEKLPLTQARVICIDDVLAHTAGANEESNLPVVAGPDNLAYVIYTSGTTGKPKGSLITHRNVVRLFPATEQWFGFNDRDVWTLFHSCAFDFSVWEIWGALLYGGRVVVVPYMISRSPEEFYELLARERVTVLNQTPSAFRQLIQAEELVGQKELALRYVIFGGEALEMQSLRPWFERHGDQKPKLINMYGITETTVHVSYRQLSKDDINSGSVVGVPIPDLQIYILDSERQPVPIGVPGEMYVGGVGLARGYLRRPELSAERFIPDHFSGRKGARLYRTGDLARFLPGRDIEYLGRVDQQVKIRGFRIELGEIESVLCEHPAIREAAVMARDDIFGAKGLVAYVVPGTPQPDSATLREHLKKTVPDYMVPNAFVFLEKMPLTASGKVDRKALPAPEKQSQDTEGQYVSPQSEMESIIANVWQQLFGKEKVSVEVNFFDLGGHSLLMIQLHSQLRKALNKDFSVVTLFEYPTIRSLAHHLREKSDETPANGDKWLDRAERQKQALGQMRDRTKRRVI